MGEQSGTSPDPRLGGCVMCVAKHPSGGRVPYGPFSSNLTETEIAKQVVSKVARQFGVSIDPDDVHVSREG